MVTLAQRMTIVGLAGRDADAPHIAAPGQAGSQHEQRSTSPVHQWLPSATRGLTCRNDPNPNGVPSFGIEVCFA
jgi:hypothetical protein